MTDLELFHLPGACSRVTLTALEWTGAPFTLTVPRDRADLARDDYKARNPFGQVPVLVIDGRPLTENAAIQITLARRFPEAGLLPTEDPWLDAVAISRLVTCSSQLHPIMTRVLFPQNFCDASPEAIERTQVQAMAMMHARLGAIEQAFSGPWWVGDAFSIADVYLLWITNRLIQLKLDDLKAFPKLREHVTRVKATELVAKVLAREAAVVAELEASGAVVPAFLRPAMIN